MRKLSEDLNPKCESVSQETHDYLFMVSGCADSLAWNMHILADKLVKDYATGYEGLVWLHSMAAHVDAISREMVEVINRLDNENKMPE
jgi:hypothetical protein